MQNLLPLTVTLMLICGGNAVSLLAQQTPAATSTTTQKAAVPAVDEWKDDFDGKALDAAKWERFTFEGGSGGKLKVEDGQLRMRGVAASRAGVRSKQTFVADHFILEAKIAKVGVPLPEIGQSVTQPGNAVLTVLFDGSGRNRIEWILTSAKTFEAWLITDGRGERLDNHNLGTKETSPIIAIARRGNDLFFLLNGEVGLQKSVSNLPRAFHVMLYGFGSSENNWDSVRVVTAKQP